MSAVLNAHFEGKLNLACVKSIPHFVCALCKVRTVCFDKLANAFDHTAAPSSSLRPIQRFIAGFALDGDLVARPVFALLPERKRIVLTIDRANWKFVGGKWMGYLNKNGIWCQIHVGNNFKLWRPSMEREVKDFHLFSGLKIGQFWNYDVVTANGQLCCLSVCRMQKGDFLVIVSFNREQETLGDYAKRRQIEMCFKAMKSNGFDIEKTLLTDLARLEKLLLLVMVAFVWCYKVGIYLRKIRPIKVKKHGRKAKSIFRCGLDYISNCLLNALKPMKIDITNFLSCT